MLALIDIGQALAGKPSGRTIVGWDAPQAYTPKGDPNYVPNKWLGDVLTTLTLYQPLWVYGPQGSGKTSGLKWLASKFNWPVYEVTAHSRLEFPELVGSYHVAKGDMVWADGPLTSALRTGGLFLINEVSLLDPATAAGLNSILDGAPLFIPETNEYVHRHEEFRIAVTDNSNGAGDSSGAYQGVLKQNAAFTSRFTFVHADYPARQYEENLLHTVAPGLPPDVIKKMLDVAELIRAAHRAATEADDPLSNSAAAASSDDVDEALPLTMSVRDTVKWARFADVCVNVEHAFRATFYNRCDNDSKFVVAQLYRRVLP